MVSAAASSAYRPHGIESTTSGATASTSDHSTVRDFSPGKPSTSRPPAGLDHLRHPVAAHVDRVEPLERRRARARRVGHGALHGVDPGRGLLHQALAGLRHPGGLGQARHVGEDLAERGRVERDHGRTSGQALGDREHVVVGHGADLADRLGHDQVHVELVERVHVELVERLALARCARVPRGRSRRQAALRDHAAGEVRQLLRAGRVVTLVRDAGHGVAEPEGDRASRWRTGPGKRRPWRRGWHV